MKRLFKLSLFVLVMALMATACAQAQPTEAPTEPAAVEETEPPEATEPPAPTEAPEPTEAPMAEPITINFWHAMGAGLGETVDELVARYNASQDEIVVNATYQGSYDDNYNALLASFETGTEPNIIQNFDLAAQTMFDTGRLIPAHVLMAEDGYDANVFIPAVRDYYSDEQGMVAMAFNSSTPIVYYNANMFEAANLEPPPPDWNFSQFLEYCDALQASGVPFCVTFGTVGWYFEQVLANSGGLYFNENNGRTGRATEVLFNQGQGVEVFDFLSGMIANGQAPNLGNTWTETDNTFFAEQAAMIFDSTAGARGLQDGAEFPVMTAFIPHSDSSDRNGVIIGGAALWLIDSGDPETNAAAWNFMKFMAETDQQVTWHTGTGYFPVRTDLQDNADLQTFWDENPNFRTALDQLLTTRTTLDDGSTNYAVLGGRAGPFPAIRRLTVEAYSRVIDDGLSAQEAMDEAADKANEELENYNAFFE